MGTILHAIAGYFFLMIVVRVLTRRPGGQMTLSDFVLVFLMGGVIILSTAGNDRSLTNCTCAVITIGLLHRMVSWAKIKVPRLGAIIDGTPIVLMKHGQIEDEIMRGMQVQRADLEAAARLKGIPSLDKADYAILERNGGISIIEKEEEGDS
ncbi:MAG TPA: YetF domain-containing protein [Acidobacteriaceae bacterium]|nr:YetF domain-containing protein [Acidobacteriaceae bacterium]